MENIIRNSSINRYHKRESYIINPKDVKVEEDFG